MRNPILERKIIPVTHPTDNQKSVLAKITASATSQLAAADISDTPNLVAARDLLVQMGLIELDDEGAHLTDQGQQVMVDQNLTTPDGSLTDDGQEAAYGEEADDAAPAGDLDLGFGDEGEDEFSFGDEDDLEGEEGGEFDFGREDGEDEDGKKDLDLRAMDNVKEPHETFDLLADLTKQALRESYNVPVEFEVKLSDEEKEQLGKVVTKGTSIYKFQSLYKKAYEHFVSDMPYGTAKGRTGDPADWLQDMLSGGEPTTFDDEIATGEFGSDASRGH